MLVFVLTTASILLAIYLYLSSNDKVPSNTKVIPSENGWPIIGVATRMKPSTYVYLNELKKKLGPIFQVKIGVQKVIVISDKLWFKKCFKDYGMTFGGRYAESILKLTSKNSGIILTNGKLWANSRSFTLRVLRDFGLGKSASEEIVSNECNYLIEELSKYSSDSLVNFKDLITLYILNIISKFIMNKRYEKIDDDLKKIRNLIIRVTRLDEPFQVLETMFPFLENFEWYKKFSLYMFKDAQTFANVHEIFRKEVRLHEKQLENKSEAEDLMDRFIMEKNKYPKDELPPEFAEFNLIRLSFDMYAAGYETTSSSITWAVFFLAYYSDVQQKVYDEICDKIGVERMPASSDRKGMHYTQAVIDDIMRMSSVVPVSIVHRTLDSCLIDDYYIPNGIMVIPNIYALHRDENNWKRPNELYPEHFLTDDGQYQPREDLAPFGMGKRQCLGEGLARMELFIFTIRMVQQFRIELPRKITEKEFNDCVLGNDSIIRTSSFGKFKFIKR